MTLSIKNGGYAFFNKIGFNVFYVVVKRVPILKILNVASMKLLVKLIL